MLKRNFSFYKHPKGQTQEFKSLLKTLYTGINQVSQISFQGLRLLELGFPVGNASESPVVTRNREEFISQITLSLLQR